MGNIVKLIKSFIIRNTPSFVSRKLFNIVPRDIVWIVHPRDINDLVKKMPIIEKFPSFFKTRLPFFISPYIVSEFNEANRQAGYIIVVPILPINFQRNKFLVSFRVRQAFRLAKKIGAKKISLGGMLTTVNEKKDFGRKFEVSVFDGTDLLAAIVGEKIINLIKENKSICSVGIIGATTKVGSKLSKILADQGIAKLHLFAKTAKNIELLAEKCRKISHGEIISHTNLNDIGLCDVCVLTAYIPEIDYDLIKRIKTGSTFYSVIEPASPFVMEIEKLRNDVHLIRGIRIQAPGLSYVDFDFAIDPGNAFACLAEALISSDENLNQPSKLIQSLKVNNFKIA